jgi:hypothetical protein
LPAGQKSIPEVEMNVPRSIGPDDQEADLAIDPPQKIRRGGRSFNGTRGASDQDD